MGLTNLLRICVLDEEDLHEMEQAPMQLERISGVSKDDCLDLDRIMIKCRELQARFETLFELAVEHKDDVNRLRNLLAEVSIETLETKRETGAASEQAESSQMEVSTQVKNLEKQLEQEVISQGSPQRKTKTDAVNDIFSMTLDVLQSEDPIIQALMNKRKRLSGELKEKMKESVDKRNLAAYRAGVCSICKLGQVLFHRNAQVSFTRANGSNCKAMAETVDVLRMVLPLLEDSLVEFTARQREREQNATQRLERARNELAEMQALYSVDELPTERREIEKRIMECESVLNKTKNAVQRVVDEQNAFWSKPYIPHAAKYMVDSALAPVFARFPGPVAHKLDLFTVNEESKEEEEEEFSTALDDTQDKDTNNVAPEQQQSEQAIPIPGVTPFTSPVQVYMSPYPSPAPPVYWREDPKPPVAAEGCFIQ